MLHVMPEGVQPTRRGCLSADQILKRRCNPGMLDCRRKATIDVATQAVAKVPVAPG